MGSRQGAEEWWDHGEEDGAASWSILARAALIAPDDKLGASTGEMRAVASRALCTALARSHAERAGFLRCDCVRFFESLFQSDSASPPFCVSVDFLLGIAGAVFRRPRRACVVAILRSCACVGQMKKVCAMGWNQCSCGQRQDFKDTWMPMIKIIFYMNISLIQATGVAMKGGWIVGSGLCVCLARMSLGARFAHPCKECMHDRLRHQCLCSVRLLWEI